jgi:hypothetical protein
VCGQLQSGHHALLAVDGEEKIHKRNGLNLMKTYSLTDAGTRALLIDLDNCPRQIDELPEALAGFKRAIACYGGVEPKVHVSVVPLLAAAINEGKLEIIGMEKRGKNAADFGLAFWAGRLAAEMPPETEFLILSQDADLDHVVNLLRSAGRKVERIDGKAAKIEIASAPTSAKNRNNIVKREVADMVEEYCAKQLQAGKPRPAKKTTLLNSIKSAFKNQKDIKPEEILQALLKRGVVAIAAKGRVTYPETAPTSPSLSPAPNDGELPNV